MNCKEAFDNKNISIFIKKQILLKMIHLVKKQIFKYGMYCIDNKPGNCVCDLSDKNLTVKLIDFGDFWLHFQMRLYVQSIINMLNIMMMIKVNYFF